METPDLGGFAAAPGLGLYEPLANLGDSVKAGSILGRLHSLDIHAEEPRPTCRSRSRGI